MAKTALVVIDMIQTYDFEGADDLARSVEQALPKMVDLLERAGEQGAPVIFVNDNFGEWTSSRDDLVKEALEGEHGRLVEPIRPEPDTKFVVKARHSIFYQTPLEYLLNQEDVGCIVMVGQVTEQCVLYSALDAYIRHFDVVVPRDAVAHIDEDLAEAALEMMARNMDVDVVDAGDVRF